MKCLRMARIHTSIPKIFEIVLVIYIDLTQASLIRLYFKHNKLNEFEVKKIICEKIFIIQ